MRLGKWIRVFQNIVPIPIAFSASFGLREGSRLYLAPISNGKPRAGGDAEVLISPIPTASWRSVCRLSVRLHDAPHALARATEFLRERGINIQLTEAAATFQERAHWDAVCDLAACPEFAPLRTLPYEAYVPRMQELLAKLTADLAYWSAAPANRDVFLMGPDAHADFSVLSGLNIASFRANLTSSFAAVFKGGGIELPNALEREIVNILGASGLLVAPIPSHSLITGNTEQRYLRLYFIRSVSDFIRAEIECDISRLAADGVGVLGTILTTLPETLNLLHLSVHRGESGNEIDSGIVRVIGHWNNHNEEELRRRIDAIEFTDVEGGVHANAFRLVDFATPNTAHPRVFISYSTQHDDEKLNILRNILIENNFEPVVGTELSESQVLGGSPVSQDVLSSAMEQIPTCIAFISIQSKREDFLHADGRYTLPPWLVAEEVFAFARNVRYLARLREQGVEEPRYNANAFTHVFGNLQDFKSKVTRIVRDLNAVRQSPDFANTMRATRQALYKSRTTPS